MEHPKFYVPYFFLEKSRFSELVQTGRIRADLILITRAADQNPFIENRSQNLGEQELAAMFRGWFRGFPGLHFHEHTIACMRTWNCDELRAHAKQRPLALTHV